MINQIRGFLLERGIIVRQGLRFLRQLLPDILAKRTDALSPRMVRIVSDLAGDWRQLDDRIDTVTDEIETLAKADDRCRRVMTVPGIGPIISSANRRPDDPRTHLLARQQLPVHALHPNSPGHSGAAGELAEHGFGAWLVRVIQRLHPNVLAAALANKLARIAWTVLAQERSYEARVTKAEA